MAGWYGRVVVVFLYGRKGLVVLSGMADWKGRVVVMFEEVYVALAVTVAFGKRLKVSTVAVGTSVMVTFLGLV